MEKSSVIEAIDQLNDSLSDMYLESDGEWNHYEFSTSVIKDAIEALEKQRPQKPNGWNSECWGCGYHLDTPLDRPNYCPNCGQRIDWTDYWGSEYHKAVEVWNSRDLKKALLNGPVIVKKWEDEEEKNDY